MTCTMRNWETAGKRRSFGRTVLKRETTTSSSNSNNNDDSSSSGPELLLIPIIEAAQYMTNNRDESPQRRSRNTNQPASSNTPTVTAAGTSTASSSDVNISQCSISVADITVAYNFLNMKPPHRIHIVTSSTTASIYEFDNLTDNAYDILLAFLLASIGPERIIDKPIIQPQQPPKHHHQRRQHPGHRLKSNSSITSCMDIDTLEAKHLEGLNKNETWPEKFSRRVGHVVNSLSELCDSACCSNTRGSTNGQYNNYNNTSSSSPYDARMSQNNLQEQRDMPPSVRSSSEQNPYGHYHPTPNANNPAAMLPSVAETTGFLELDEMTEASSPTHYKKYNQQPLQQQRQQHRRPSLTRRTSLDDSRIIRMLPSGLSVEPDPEVESRCQDEGS